MDMKGKCELCSCSAYLECRACLAIMQYDGQAHRCPEGCTNVIKPVLCDECDEQTRVAEK